MSKRAMIIGGLAVAALVGFLLFRPDKLFVDDVVDEGLDQAFAAADTNSTTTSPATSTPTTTATTLESTTSTTAPASTTTPPTTEATGPTLYSSGSFFGIDHRASGTASIYVQDGRYVLRFEDDTDIQNGPDLYVWLTPDTDFGDPAEGYLDLGKLKGNVGGQNYELPPEFDPNLHRHVLIWCLRFTVPFAAAEMS